MQLKGLILAAVMATAPVAANAAVSVSVFGIDGVGPDSFSGDGGVSLLTPIDGVPTVLSPTVGMSASAFWFTQVQSNGVPPIGGANMSFDFTTTDKSKLLFNGTNIPFPSLSNLTIQLLINGTPVDSTSGTGGLFSLMGMADTSDLVSVVYDWDGFVPNAIIGVISGSMDATRIPVPASLVLFGSALLGVGVIARRRKH